MADECRGQISLTIDDAHTRAVLSITPNPKGGPVSTAKILMTLRERGILSVVNPAVVEKAVQTFSARPHEPLAVTIAQGKSPVSTTPAQVRWEDHPIPDHLAQTARDLFKQPTAEETAGMKRGDVVTTGYVAGRTQLAVLVKSGPGQEGLSLFGEPIPAPEPHYPEITFGQGLAREDNKLCALTEGFYRRGENWVELIPYRAKLFSLEATPDGSDCLLSYDPGSGEQPLVSVDRILERAEELGFKKEDLIDRNLILRRLRAAAEGKKPLTGLSLCRPRDAFVSIAVSADKLFATLTLHKGRGNGKPLKLNEIAGLIKNSGITQIDTARLRERILAFYNDPAAREFADPEFARGTLPGPGVDGSLEWELGWLDQKKKDALLERFAAVRGLEKTLPSLNAFPLAQVRELAMVIPEQKIALVNPPAPGKDGLDVFGKKIEGSQGKPVSVTTYENIKQFGLYLVSEIRGILEYGQDGEEHRFRIRPHQDAECLVELTQDRMRAFLTILPSRGAGAPLVEEAAAFALKEAGVTFGINHSAVRDAVSLGRRGKAVTGLLAAEGRPPVHAEGARFVVKVAREKKKPVRIRQDGRADFKTAEDIPIVKTGELVAEITPPLHAPQDGYDVTGAVLPARTQTHTTIPKTINVKPVHAPGGGIRLFAEVDGEFFMTADNAGVRRLHVIDGDVDLSTGHVRFPGSVAIAGSVQTGFSVVSGGDVTIKGMVEEALVSADGSIRIDQGVKGKAKAVLRAKGDIHCLFAENATLLAVGDVVIDRSTLSSTVKCNGALTVGRTKGTLMGGVTKARKGMTLINLGAVSEVKTEVSFGQDYILMEQIEKTEQEVESLSKETKEIDGRMTALKRSGGPVQDKLTALREEKVSLLKKIETHKVRLFHMRERCEEHYPAEIVIRGTVFPGVIIESHGRILTVKQEKSGVRYRFNPAAAVIEELYLSRSKGKAGRSA
ncbi:MAG TPA: DUF342 domain-containing protein [Spirochaetia bacterium]|nr:DUF342 domain-containing protein [Spirochaetia bacterium]